MRKAILIVMTMMVLIVPVYAMESDSIMDKSIQQQEKETVTVASLEELQQAIDAAEYEDTIYLSAAIGISGETIETDKKLILASNNEQNGELLRLYDGATIKGFSFSGSSFYGTSFVRVIGAISNGVTIANCNFEYFGDNSVNFIHIYGDFGINKTHIEQCSFVGATGSAIEILANTEVRVDSCLFNRNQKRISGLGGAILSSGKLCVKNSIFTDNYAFSAGGILCSGELHIENCLFTENTVAQDQDGTGRDILSTGKITIACGIDDGFDFYDEITGQKIDLPLIDHEGVVQLSYLTEEQAIECFAPKLPEEKPQQPEQASQGDNEDDPTDTPSQPPEQSKEPPQGDSTDNPVGATPDTPQQPQEPSQSGNTNDDDYTHPADYRPSQRPMWPSTSTSNPIEQPQLQPGVSEEKPQLICNGAVIDASRTIVLFGYGDGQLHEADSLTRAQLATIIYRLLDNETIARYRGVRSIFADVTTDAWYAPYVNVIGAVGIVNGVGAGQYDPDGVVTWAQIITILSRFVDAQEIDLQHIQYDGWATPALKTAVALGWIKDSATFNPDAIISRGELIQLVSSVLALYR